MSILDLDVLLKSDDAIYVKNSTRPKGKVICTFTDINTRSSRPFSVPKTWIPIKVSGAIPKEVIRQSMDFRRHLDKGMLTLISASEAEAMLKSEDAQEELRRLNQSEFAGGSAFASQAVQELLDAVDAKVEMAKLNAQEIKIEDEMAAAEDITPAILDIVTRVNGKGIEVKAALNELKCIEDDLNTQDASYIIANCDGNIRQWAKAKLESLLEAQES